MHGTERNIVDFLDKFAIATPEKTVFIFLKNGEDEEKRVSFSELRMMAVNLSQYLAEKKLPGERVLLVYQDVLHFIVAFLACQYCGVVAIPASYGRGSRQVERLKHLLTDADASTVLCTADSMNYLQKNLAANSGVPALEMIASDNYVNGSGQLPSVSHDLNRLAFIQYSSGSTGKPKGVMITAGNLLHNQRLIASAFGCTADSVIFSWLPFHHDMGLIGNILHAIYCGCTAVLMSPIHFMQRPRRWLQGISRYKATHSGGPNFSFDLCVSQIPPGELATLDLSCWKVAYNGSEPVQPATLQRFADYFLPAGFQAKSFYPCYGLAEATLLVSAKKHDQLPVTVTIEKQTGDAGSIKLANGPGTAARTIAGSGVVADGVQLKVVSLHDERECEELQEGEICIAGDSISQGYWNRALKKGLFYVTDYTKFLRTGDLGFIYKGELFVHGRTKEMMIIRGQNIYPYDIEQFLSASHPAIESNGVAIFPAGQSGENIVIIAEIKRTRIQDLPAEELLRFIQQAVKGNFGIDVHDIVLTTPLGIPRTTSGKLQRIQCRELYQQAALPVIASWLNLETGTASSKKDSRLVADVKQKGGREIIKKYLLQIIGPVADNIAGEDTCLTDIGIDSLRAVELANIISKDLDIVVDPAQMLQENSLSACIRFIENSLLIKTSGTPGEKDDWNTVPAMPAAGSYPVSSAQRRMWILNRAGRNNGAYNIVTGFHLAGVVHTAALAKAFHIIIDRHESLRTVFREEGVELRQVILPAIPFEMELVTPGDNFNSSIRAGMYTLNGWPFDLAQGPLIKVQLYCKGEKDFVLLVALSHIIADGWSVRVLMQEVLRAYHSLCSGEMPVFEPLAIQYKDYALREVQYINTPKAKKASEFWKEQFAAGETPAALPWDFARPASGAMDGAVYKIWPGEALFESITAFCRDHKITLFTFCRCVLSVLLNRYSGQSFITIGIPVSRRNHTGLENQVGLFVNTLPMCAAVLPGNRFVDVLLAISANSFQAMTHADYPFDKIVDDLQVRRDGGRQSLFDVMLALQDTLTGSQLPGNDDWGFSLQPADGFLYDDTEKHRNTHAAKFDLTFNLGREVNQRFYIEIEYSKTLFRPQTIERVAGAFLYVISQVLENPAIPVGEIELVTAAESQHLFSFNNNDRGYPAGKTIVDLFKEQVQRTPGNISLVYGQQQLSYARLNERSDAVACYLRRHHDIQGNELIGVQLSRSEWLVITLLGVLKAGAAYVPIDTAYPAERIAFIIADSGCKLVLNETWLHEFLQVENDEYEEPALTVAPAAIAYVIYTSGSTGQPKGVMIEHRNATAFLHWCLNEFSNSTFDTVLCVTSVCFDLSVFEIFYTLCSGKKLRIIENALSIPEYLDGKEKILLNTVPAVVQALVNENVDLQAVTVLNMAGEPIPPGLIRELDCERREVRNLYGPSEDTTYSTVYRIKNGDPILIGRPLANTQIYILGDTGKLLPAGAVGEIYIGGAGLARGYLNRPALTAEKFLSNPFRRGERMYKTGDLGRWTSSGHIEFIGRKDDQVKIRGYRIEPGEIEHVLAGHAGIGAVVVAAQPLPGMGNCELVAYFTARTALSSIELRQYLCEKLPAYMIPGRFVQVDRLPVTPNGKIDKKALLQTGSDIITGGSTSLAPGNETAKKLVAIWEEILMRRGIGLQDHFFDLGGNSLKIIRLAGRIHQVFDVKIEVNRLLQMPVPEMQARWIDQARRNHFEPIAVVDEQPHYPLSAAQRRLWVLSQFEEASLAYMMPAVFLLEGSLNKKALQDSFNKLIQRHESLRTVFRECETGETRQFILNPDTCHFTIGYTVVRDMDDVNQLLNEKMLQPFNLGSWPLLRADIIQLNDNKYLLAFNMHHIISDGWSINILVSEWGELYNAIYNNETPDLPKLPVQYKDYVAWLAQQLQSEIYLQDKQYWIRQLEGELPVLSLPADLPRPVVKTYNGGRWQQRIHNETVSHLRSICRRQDSTLFMGLAAAVNALLYRYTGQAEIITGIPVAGREHPGLNNQVGLYVNTLALRTRFSPGVSFTELLNHVKQQSLNAYAHQRYPFDALIDALELRPDMSRNAVFDVMVVLQDEDDQAAALKRALNGLQISSYPSWQNPAGKFDLTFNFLPAGENVILEIEYNSDLFFQDTIVRMAGHFCRLLETAVRHPLRPLYQLDYMGQEEKHLLLHTFNDTVAEFDRSATMAQLFRQQVRKTPGATAVICEERVLTYHELDIITDQLARYLADKYNTGRNDLVAVSLSRGEWMIIALLGILKAGAAYLPVDPEYPKDRIDYMIADSQCRAVLDEAAIRQFRLEAHLYSTGELPLNGEPEDLFYVIYTSGSSGRPKGVRINQLSFINLITWYGKLLALKQDDCFLLMAPVSFDLAQKNIFTPLVYGNTLCVPAGLYGDYTMLADTIAYSKATIINAAPSAFYPLLDPLVNDHYRKLSSLRHVVLGGEPILKSQVDAWMQSADCRAKLINSYGPTECTDVVSSYTIEGDEWNLINTIPIGAPAANCRIYILDEHGTLVAPGITGEICIGGACVGNGYLNRPEQTALKFVPDPFHAGESMYRTGDLGKWSAQGNVEFLGRKDDQVKIRGYRIELGEIENCLNNYPGITLATVISFTNNHHEQELLAYYTGNIIYDLDHLRSYLLQTLAVYMVPSHFIHLQEFPMTPSGKVNRKVLRDMSGSIEATEAPVLPPRNETEAQLVAAWKEVLGKQRVSINDNFFSLGGHSLKLARLSTEIARRMGAKLSFKDLFAHPVLHQQAVLVNNAVSADIPLLPVAVRQLHYPLSSAQKRLWVLSQLEDANIAYNIAGVYELEGNADITAFNKALQTLVARHESLRTVFREDESGSIRQYILNPDHVNTVLETIDMTDDQPLPSLVQNFCHRPFDLANGPLLRACLVRTGPERQVVSFVLHHIISDGWSMGILVDELIYLYEAFVRDSEPEWPPLRIHYKDYACWQAGLLQQDMTEEHKTYWINQFRGVLPVLKLPEDRPRPEVQTYRGAIIKKDLGTSLYNSLKQFSATEGGTVFTGLLSALSILLYRYTGQHEMIIGSPVAGREHMELQNQIGLYINTLALRVHFNGEDHFGQVFKHIRQVVVDAYEHQEYPFDELVSLVNAERDLSRNALFDVMIVLENEDAVRPEERTMGALKIRQHTGLEITTSKLDLLFLFKEHNSSLSLTIEYNSDIFNHHTVEQLAENFEGLMAAAINEPLLPVCRLDYLNEPTKKQLLYTFNNTTDGYDENEMVLSCIKKYAIGHADAVAVSAGDIDLTYGELDARSNLLAAWLQQHGGVSAGDRVGVQLPRNEWLIIALLAAWKAGAAYVPIDPLYPPDRIDFIIADSQCKTIIDESLLDRIKQVVLPGSSLQYCKQDQNDPAYIIYTSGSTGKPKGVMIAHRSVTAFINWCHKEFARSRFQVVFAATSVCFDLSVFEIFFTLSCGRRLRLLPDALAIPAYLEQEKEVLLNTVPSVVGALLREQVNWPAVTVLNIAGEPIPRKYIDALDCASIEVRNLYGPTEDTTYSTCYRIRNGEPVLIGRPISNTQVYILDENLQLMPVGANGEICLGGDGLANGYLNQPALTAMKFIDNPFFPGQRIYRTGDIGRWLPDGNIELAGRKDNQVKIRGHRIEPGEIEDVLQGLSGIDKAVVLVEEDDSGDKKLVAFIQGRGEPELSALRTGLRNKLPSYMMPAMFIQVDQFPLTPNGKIDTAQLRQAKGRTLLNITEYLAPRNDIEQQLTGIWQEVLGRQRIGVKDNFFEAGGHSLKAAQLISRINKNFDVRINLLNIFREPTIENIAEQISFTLHQDRILKNKKDLIRIEV